MSGGRRVRVEKRKWDGTVSGRWEAELLSEPPGPWTWLARAGTVRERPRRGETETLERDELCVAGGEWWVVTCVLAPDGGVERYEVDAAVPVRRSGSDEIAFIDLDLDLEVDGGGGGVSLEDESDFRRRAQEMGYPPEVRSGAWRGLRDAAARLSAREWPFDEATPATPRREGGA